MLLASSRAAAAQSEVVGWGTSVVDSAWNQELFVEVEGGYAHTIARRGDGTAVAWGSNDNGQCDVPAPPPGLVYVKVAGCTNHNLALCSDGTVVAWGGWAGQLGVPALPPGLTYVEVAGGDAHSYALRSDGAVVAWGSNSVGQCNVPALPPGLAYVEVAAGGRHGLARRSDGSVVAWGHEHFGQCNTPALPPGLVYLEIGAGAWHNIARYGTEVVSASATFRTGGTNPVSHAAITLPVLGTTYIAAVDLAGTTGHDQAWLAGYGTPLTLTLSGGQTLLLDVADPGGELLGLAFLPGPVASYHLPVPADPAFAGLAASTQALHWGGIQPWELSNAQDLVLGW
ncbi:MAG: hypothetical protein AB1726_01905 [Planctomycetota bacterium]